MRPTPTLTPGLALSALLALGLTVGCGDKGDDDTGAVGDMLTGTITPDDAGFSGELAIAKAFGFDQGGTLIVYMSSDSNATCDSVYDFLGGDDDPYDPVDIFEDGYCNMFVKVTGFDGTFKAENDSVAAAGTAISCPMGDGEWVYETRDGDDKDYYWDPAEQWWRGYPTTYTYDFSGSSSEGYTLDIEMSVYDGGFEYVEWENTAATGSVSGSVQVEYCQQMGTLGFI